MQPRVIRPECYACLERLIALTAQLASPDPEVQRQACQAARGVLDQEFGPDAVPAFIANRFLPIIHRICGNPDPFASRKAAATDFMGRMYRRLAPQYGDDLESLLRLAAAGNALDFFRGYAEVSQVIEDRVEFGIAEVFAFRRELDGPAGLLLYLADNAGEQFFDQPLVTHLRRRGWRVVYVVKGGPIQNDLTRADLAASGLLAALEPVVDSGACTVGLEPEQVSPEFRKLYETARLILAKGMGHFESMVHLHDPRVWFMLQAKCIPVAGLLGVAPNTYVFGQAGAIFVDKESRKG